MPMPHKAFYCTRSVRLRANTGNSVGAQI